MNVLSPIPRGCGAHVLHAELARSLPDYQLLSYSAWRTLFPLLLPTLVDRRAELVHADADYGMFYKRPGVPLVLTMHGYRLDRFMRAYSSPLQYLHYRTDLRLYTKLGLAIADGVVAISRFVAQRMRDDLGFDGDIRLIYNGVDTDRFLPSDAPRQSGPFRVLFCGNHKPGKRPDLLLPLANALGERFEIHYTAGLTGRGQLEGRLNANAAALHCLGKVEYADMPRIYRSMDVLFMPSVREGFGLCVAEAMACGLPVVAADSSALPELVVNDEGGYLVPVDDLLGFAEAIRRIAEEQEKARRMGQYNRARVEQHFTLRRMVSEYRDLFEEVRSR